MDFARKQLEKYGWIDGKGLGKHENGIAEALKPKLKRSVAGIGHDAASDFTEHWWTTLYNKAAENVQVEKKNGKVKKIKTNEANFEITNSSWKLNKKPKKGKSDEQYEDFFIKKSILTNGGCKVQKVDDSDSSDNDEKEKKDVLKMTDEELFAACEGRTAHKGARHGLKALGKLARIEQQEQILLQQSRFQGYSAAKSRQDAGEMFERDQIFDDVGINSEIQNKSKKKRKRCLKLENNSQYMDVDHENILCEENAVIQAITDEKIDGVVTISEIKRNKFKRKRNILLDNDSQYANHGKVLCRENSEINNKKSEKINTNVMEIDSDRGKKKNAKKMKNMSKVEQSDHNELKLKKNKKKNKHKFKE